MIRHTLFLLLAVAIAPPAATAHSHTSKGLEIVHPWAQEAPRKDAATAQVFMTIKNRGRRPDRLLSASTPVADKTELRNAGADAKSAATLTIPAGETLVLHSKGPHLVLTGVKKALYAYDDFKLTLVFEKAGRVVVDVIVEEASEPHKH